MTVQTQMPVSQLEGVLLDYFVAVAKGYWGSVVTSAYISMTNSDEDYLAVAFPQERADRWNTFSPHKKWEEAGPIIERERMVLCPADYGWFAEIYEDSFDESDCIAHHIGETPLAAAMRCYVSSKLGDIVTIPAELAHLVEGE